MNADMDAPRRFHDGSRFEQQAGYARAARHGPYIAVSGTTVSSSAEEPHLYEHRQPLYEQTLAAFRVALDAVEKLGGKRTDVIRTRIFLAPGQDWQPAAEAHREIFAGIDPANTTLFVAGFIPAGVLVEIEVDAYVL